MQSIYINIKCKTVTKFFTILTKCSFPYLNPASYLNRHINKWYPSVDETFCFIYYQSANFVLFLVKKFPSDVQFTCELERVEYP